MMGVQWDVREWLVKKVYIGLFLPLLLRNPKWEYGQNEGKASEIFRTELWKLLGMEAKVLQDKEKQSVISVVANFRVCEVNEERKNFFFLQHAKEDSTKPQVVQTNLESTALSRSSGLESPAFVPSVSETRTNAVTES